MVHQVSTKDMSREEWLEHRKKGLGGSDAASILGLNPYSSPFSVWADKTGKTPPTEDNEAMRQGRDLEQYVADRWMEATGKKCRKKNAILFNDEYPFALANIDRDVIGENAGLECKTTSVMNLKKFKNGNFPETYYCQCMWYMAITGAERWYLAVLVLNKEFLTFVIERDEAEIKALMDTGREFWKYVETNTPPPMDGSIPNSDTLSAMYGYSKQNETPIYLPDRLEVCERYQEVKKQIKELETVKRECEQILQEDLKDNEIGECERFSVSWKPQTRSSFDVKSFTMAHPEIDLSGFYKQTNFRKFEVKERK